MVRTVSPPPDDGGSPGPTSSTVPLSTAKRIAAARPLVTESDSKSEKQRRTGCWGQPKTIEPAIPPSRARAITRTRPTKKLAAIGRAATDDSLRRHDRRCKSSVRPVVTTLYGLFCGANNVGSKGWRSVAKDYAMALCETLQKYLFVSRVSMLPRNGLRLERTFNHRP